MKPMISVHPAQFLPRKRRRRIRSLGLEEPVMGPLILCGVGAREEQTFLLELVTGLIVGQVTIQTVPIPETIPTTTTMMIRVTPVEVHLIAVGSGWEILPRKMAAVEPVGGMREE
jgi:hypothetical protein